METAADSVRFAAGVWKNGAMIVFGAAWSAWSFVG